MDRDREPQRDPAHQRTRDQGRDRRVRPDRHRGGRRARRHHRALSRPTSSSCRPARRTRQAAARQRQRAPEQARQRFLDEVGRNYTYHNSSHSWRSRASPTPPISEDARLQRLLLRCRRFEFPRQHPWSGKSSGPMYRGEKHIARLARCSDCVTSPSTPSTCFGSTEDLPMPEQPGRPWTPTASLV